MTLPGIPPWRFGSAAFDARLDAESAPLLRRRPLRLVEADGARLTVDLSAIEALDAAGVAVLTRVLVHARRHGGEVAVITPRRSAARRTLDLTGLAPLFAVPDAA